MKLIIAGSRDIVDFRMVVRPMAEILQIERNIIEIVSGHCLGVDSLGEEWAYHNKIPIKYFPAHWRIHGKRAGPIRNSEMASYADALLAVWRGPGSPTRGTADMLRKARAKNLVVWTYDGVKVELLRND